MEKAMRHQTLPAIDSIEELARFWETHDLVDFEQDLEEADEPIFVRHTGTSLTIDLQPLEAQRLKRIARSRHVKEDRSSTVDYRSTSRIFPYSQTA